MADTMFLGMGRRPMHKLDRDYMQVPMNLICGEGVSVGNLNARAFSRTLDNLFGLDLTQIIFDIYGMPEREYRFLRCTCNMNNELFGHRAHGEARRA